MRRLLALLLALQASPSLAADATKASGSSVVIKVTEDGFEPREVKLKKGEATTLVFKRVTDDTCITAVDIPAEGVKGLDLPLDEAVKVTVTPKKAGTEAFHCSAMGMGDGRLVVTE